MSACVDQPLVVLPESHLILLRVGLYAGRVSFLSAVWLLYVAGGEQCKGSEAEKKLGPVILERGKPSNIKLTLQIVSLM